MTELASTCDECGVAITVDSGDDWDICGPCHQRVSAMSADEINARLRGVRDA